MRAISRLGSAWIEKPRARAIQRTCDFLPKRPQEKLRNDFWALVSGAEYDANHKEGRQEEDRQALDQKGRSQDHAADDEEAVRRLHASARAAIVAVRRGGHLPRYDEKGRRLRRPVLFVESPRRLVVARERLLFEARSNQVHRDRVLFQNGVVELPVGHLARLDEFSP